MAANHTLAELQAMLNHFHTANPVEAAKLVLPAAVNQPWAVGGAVEFWTEDEWWEATVYDTPAATTAEPAATAGSWRDGKSLNRQVLAGSPLWPKQTEVVVPRWFRGRICSLAALRMGQRCVKSRATGHSATRRCWGLTLPTNQRVDGSSCILLLHSYGRHNKVRDHNKCLSKLEFKFAVQGMRVHFWHTKSDLKRIQSICTSLLVHMV